MFDCLAISEQEKRQLVSCIDNINEGINKASSSVEKMPILSKNIDIKNSSESANENQTIFVENTVVLNTHVENLFIEKKWTDLKKIFNGLSLEAREIFNYINGKDLVKISSKLKNCATVILHQIENLISKDKLVEATNLFLNKRRFLFSQNPKMRVAINNCHMHLLRHMVSSLNISLSKELINFTVCKKTDAEFYEFHTLAACAAYLLEFTSLSFKYFLIATGSNDHKIRAKAFFFLSKMSAGEERKYI